MFYLILFIIICAVLASNVGSTLLVLAREDVSSPVISSSLDDVCLIVSDVLLALAGIVGGISS